MNTFLLVYLIILLFEAILSTILKYAWQAEEKWDEPWYNQKTEHDRNSSKVKTKFLVSGNLAEHVKGVVQVFLVALLPQ